MPQAEREVLGNSGLQRGRPRIWARKNLGGDYERKDELDASIFRLCFGF